MELPFFVIIQQQNFWHRVNNWFGLMEIWTSMTRMLQFASAWAAFAACVLAVSSCRSAHYEGRAALPQPPVIVTWTHIKAQAPLKCCELQQPSQPKHSAASGSERRSAIWGQTLERTVATSNKQQGAYGRAPMLPTLFFIFFNVIQTSQCPNAPDLKHTLAC